MSTLIELIVGIPLLYMRSRLLRFSTAHDHLYGSAKYCPRHVSPVCLRPPHTLSNPTAVMAADRASETMSIVIPLSPQQTSCWSSKHKHNSEFLFDNVRFQSIDETNKLYTRGRKKEKQQPKKDFIIIVVQEV